MLTLGGGVMGVVLSVFGGAFLGGIFQTVATSMDDEKVSRGLKVEFAVDQM